MRKKIEFQNIDNYLSNITIFDDKNFKKNTSTKNQLFREHVPFEFINDLFIECFNIELNLSTQYSFSKKTIKNRNIIDIIISKIDNLKKYYIKCKHKIYLENLNEKKIITLLRQLLRLHEFNLSAKEKYENNQKYLLYTVTKKVDIVPLKKINSTINFD
jgi:hypothetical protein